MITATAQKLVVEIIGIVEDGETGSENGDDLRAENKQIIH